MKAYTKVKLICKGHKETVVMLLGILFGVLLGSTASSFRTFSTREVMLVGFLGEIFMRVLRLIAVPLLVCCLVSGLANLQEGLSFKMILKYLAITLLLNVEGALIVIAFSLIIHPGMSVQQQVNDIQLLINKKTLQDMFLDLGRNLVPSNPMGMFSQSYDTVLRNDTSGECNFIPGGEVLQNANMIGIVAVSMVFGIVTRKLGDEATFLKDLVNDIMETTFLWMRWILFVSPVLLASLVGAQIMKTGVTVLISRTGRYVATFLSYLSAQFLVVYPLSFFILTRKNPFRYYSGTVILTALGTSSSLATLPLAIAFLEQNCQFDPRLVSVFLSIGININKIGGMMGLCGASIFIAQAKNITTDFPLFLKIFLLSVPISVAAPAVPYALIAALASVLIGCGIPSDDVSLVLAVEWLNDRLITVINIFGNVFTVAIMANFYKEQFLKPDIS